MDEAHRLGAALRARGWTVAAAESLTAGRVQSLIASVSGASAYFLGGLTAYTLAQKVALLGVDAAHAAEVDCVSARVAEEMVRGAVARFGASVAVATTGYAEPWGDVTEPMAFCAVWVGGQVRVQRVTAPGMARAAAQAHVARAAVLALVDEIDRAG